MDAFSVTCWGIIWLAELLRAHRPFFSDNHRTIATKVRDGNMVGTGMLQFLNTFPAQSMLTIVQGKR